MNLQILKPEASLTSLLNDMSINRKVCTIGNADIVYAIQGGDYSKSKVGDAAAVVSAVTAVVAVSISLKVKSKDLLINEE